MNLYEIYYLQDVQCFDTKNAWQKIGIKLSLPPAFNLHSYANASKS